MITESVKSGVSLSKLKPVIGIMIVDKYFTLNDEFHSLYYLMNVRTGRIPDYRMGIHFISIDKFRKGETEGADEGLLRWIEFINTEDSEVRKMLSSLSPGLKSAYESMEDIHNDPAFKEYLWSKEKFERDQVSRDEHMYREGIEEGIGIGREEGIGIGREEGIGIGREEGIGAVAVQLKAEGCSYEMIAKVTGLSFEVIEGL